MQGLHQSESPQASAVRANTAIIDAEEGNDMEEEEESQSKDCCLTQILSLQADFKSEPSLLEEVSKLNTYLQRFLSLTIFLFPGHHQGGAQVPFPP